MQTVYWGTHTHHKNITWGCGLQLLHTYYKIETKYRQTQLNDFIKVWEYTLIKSLSCVWLYFAYVLYFCATQRDGSLESLAYVVDSCWYTGWFKTCDHYSRKLFLRSLWVKCYYQYESYSQWLRSYVFFNCRKCPPVNRTSPRHAKRPWTNCNWKSQHQLQLATRAVQPSGRDELRPAVAFSKTCLKHRSV